MAPREERQLKTGYRVPTPSLHCTTRKPTMKAINLELSKQHYAAGDSVEGEVALQLDDAIPCRGVRVRLNGYERACWSTGSGKTRVTFSEKLVYFKEQLTLFGRPPLPLTQLAADSLQGFFSKDTYDRLDAGTHRYRFSYQLPPVLPGCYQSDTTGSQIEYQVVAYVDLPLKFDLKTTQPLAVYERPATTTSESVVATKQKSFLFNQQSSIEATLHLDKTTFFLGEKLSGRLDVANRSFKQLEAARIELQRVEHLRAHAATHDSVATVCSAAYPHCAVSAHSQKRLPVGSQIPRDLCPSIQQSKLVRVEYQLRVVLQIPWAVDLKVIAPIVLLDPAGTPNVPSEV